MEQTGLKVKNLNYEKSYLKREIGECRHWRGESLEKLCCDELGLDPSAADAGDKLEEAIDTHLLGGLSHRDPSNHDQILAKLKEDGSTRSSLVEQLKESKLELKELQAKREELKGFLDAIPKRLKEMNSAGERLEGFFVGCKASWLADSAEKKLQTASALTSNPSSQRFERFDLAQSLPSPLYVLFVQLSGYIDAWGSVNQLESAEREEVAGGFVGAEGMHCNAVQDGEGWNVELRLDTLNILPSEIATLLGRGSKGEVVKIVFSYDTELGVVRARVSEGGDEVLDNLFPGDDGLVCPNVSAGLLKQEDVLDAKECDSAEGGTTAGKPYHWCQVLSGLNFPPPSSRESNTPFQINVCTKAFFRQLLRRIRARRSLLALLDFLGRRGQIPNLPVHPLFRGEDNTCKAKVVSWVEEKEKHNVSLSPSMKRYVATIKRKSSMLRATVIIDVQNYPADPPVWSLANEDGSTSSSSWGEQNGNISNLNDSGSKAPPLFDAVLHRIESQVNTELDQFVSQGVETTYDWILVHQLVDIVACWDELMSVGEGSKERDGRRVRRGKDRRLVGFGEGSPFSFYRNGL